jgi:O-antigen/teichoic acid export membrane protein
VTAAKSTTSDLRRLLLRGSFFEVGGYGAQVILRMGSNLILTRLLFPAAFGLSSIVSTLSAGLYMLSDVAIQPCVIQSNRGDDPAFLNTAFTLQAMRGVALALVMVMLAKPASWFYHEPQLEPLVYIGALQLIFGGLHSTSIFTLRRRLASGWINGFELGTGVVATAFTLILTRAFPSPKALVIGLVFSAFVQSLTSHFLPVPYRNHFQWDKKAAEEIRRFGRWIFGSSAATYLGGQSDRILLGRFLGAAWLGVYGIALNLTEILSALIGRIGSGIMYPALSRAAKEPGRDLSAFFYRFRLRLDLLSMSSMGLLAGAGGWLVRLLWDTRYANAAWIVQILSIRVAITLIVTPTETCLLALGQTRNLFLRSSIRLLGTLTCIPIGWYLGGVKGVIWGAVVSEIPTIFAVWPRSRHLGILRIRRELLAIGIFCAAYLVGRVLLPWLPNLHLK